MLNFAFTPSISRDYAALGAWAIRGWAASRGWRRSNFEDVVNATGHAGYRRAAAAGLRGRSGRDHARLDRIARAHPEMAPALGWAVSA